MNQFNLDDIYNFICKKINEEEENIVEIDKNTELVESRIISSLLLIQIITGIEDIIETSIITDDVSLEDFSTINGILNIVNNTLGRNSCEE